MAPNTAPDTTPPAAMTEVEGLVTDGGRIGFEINTGVTREAGLVLSSKLLRLARQLHPAP